MQFIDYHRKDTLATIIIHENGQYTAVTAALSKTYKSLRGAEKMMSELGYTKSNK